MLGPTFDTPPSRIELIERGLVRTQSGLGERPPADSFSLLFDDGVLCGDEEDDEALEVTDL